MPAGAVEQAGPSVYALLKTVVEEYHNEEFGETGVTFDLIFAYAPTNKEGVVKGPPLKDSYGVPVESKTKVNRAPQRSLGYADVEITIDANNYRDASPEKQAAILDMALCRIEICKDEEGNAEIDDLGRPKLSRRVPDYHAVGYHDVIDRHRQHATETDIVRNLARDLEIKGYNQDVEPQVEE